MKNRLANSNSPYLLQHAKNPVDWYPWGVEALSIARAEDKPIFLSIGYAACHWCHVMAHESFEDPAVAEIMNSHFVNIKVDREERPDLDNIYMTAVVAMTGHGGWPLSVFLTPDGSPFYGGTYFPPAPSFNLPSFRDLLFAIERAWRDERPKIVQAGVAYTKHLKSLLEVRPEQDAELLRTLDQAAQALVQSYDWKHGGWGQAPKFPQSMAIDYLLRRATRGDQPALDVAVHALKAMAKGGMFDVIGGGFSRYSTDNDWLIPHFEKMLYDNALLASAYLHAYLITREDSLRQVCERTLDFLAREMLDPEDGFYSSIDADSEGEEGKFYTWTPKDVKSALPDPASVEFVLTAYGITEAGNFEGKSVLRRVLDDAALARDYRIHPDEAKLRIEGLETALLMARNQRVRPGTDDKVLAAWNGLALVAFSEAGRFLKREDYKKMAMRNGGFLADRLISNGRVLRSWREGRAMQAGFLEDYASLALGFLALFQTDPDPRWFQTGMYLAGQMLVHFEDPRGGFFDTADDQEKLLIRPKDIQDNATPSGNALACLALLQLGAYQGNADFQQMAMQMLADVLPSVVKYPTAFGYWLCANDFAIHPPIEVALLGDSAHPAMQSLIDMLWSQYRPNLVAAISHTPPLEGVPALLHKRIAINGLPTAYVCRSFECKLPVHAPEQLRDQLDSESPW